MSLVVLLILLMAAGLVIGALFLMSPSLRKTPQRRGRPSVQEEYGEEIAPRVQRFDHGLAELPKGYGEDRLVLLVRDPYNLYAYWELTEGLLAEKAGQYGAEQWLWSRPVLRLYNDDGVAREIPLSEEADNWFIGQALPNFEYRAVLGRVLADGRFVELLVSNPVTTPTDRISPVIDPAWPPLEPLFAPWTAGGRWTGATSPSLSPKKG